MRGHAGTSIPQSEDTPLPCCDIEQFVHEFAHYWNQAQPSPSPLLIDWTRALSDWRQHHCTGAESVRMQVDQLKREADYLWLSGPDQSGPNGGGPARPQSPRPVLGPESRRPVTA